MSSARKNAFAVFQIEARPYVAQEVIEQRFRELSASGSVENQELEEARKTLADTYRRLNLLCELEQWIEGTPSQLPAMTTDLYTPVRRALARADACLNTKADQTLPPQEITQSLEDCRGAMTRVQESLDCLDAEVAEVDRAWPGNKDAVRKQLTGLVGAYAYQKRWLEQLQERSTKLAQLNR